MHSAMVSFVSKMGISGAGVPWYTPAFSVQYCYGALDDLVEGVSRYRPASCSAVTFAGWAHGVSCLSGVATDSLGRYIPLPMARTAKTSSSKNFTANKHEVALHRKVLANLPQFRELVSLRETPLSKLVSGESSLVKQGPRTEERV